MGRPVSLSGSHSHISWQLGRLFLWYLSLFPGRPIAMRERLPAKIFLVQYAICVGSGELSIRTSYLSYARILGILLYFFGRLNVRHGSFLVDLLCGETQFFSNEPRYIFVALKTSPLILELHMKGWSWDLVLVQYAFCGKEDLGFPVPCMPCRLIYLVITFEVLAMNVLILVKANMWSFAV